MTKHFTRPGDVFSRLTVTGEIERVERYGKNVRAVECRCSCGNIKTILIADLFKQNSRSCGCLQIERATKAMHAKNTKHGESHKTDEYRLWKNIKSRCLNPNVPCYKRYGGRGIGIAKEWEGSFEAFISHIGRRPSKLHTLDRINNAIGYEPGNVRWATQQEQQRNRRDNRFIEHNGERLMVSEWAKKTGVTTSTISRRLKSGWSVEKALSKSDGRKNMGRNK